VVAVFVQYICSSPSLFPFPFPFPSLSIFRSSFFLVEFSVSCWFICRVVRQLSFFFPCKTFLISFFLFFALFFQSLCICTRYAGLSVILFRSRTEIWTNTNSMSRFPTKDMCACPRSLVGSVRVLSSGLGFQFHDAGNEVLLFQYLMRT
jgi:hypothetical protein